MQLPFFYSLWMNTMNRCICRWVISPSLKPLHTIFALQLSALMVLGLAFTPLPSSAQSIVREFPRTALRGTLEVIAPPEVMLDGKTERLSPGSHIHSPQNMLMMSGSLVGQKWVVNFTRESTGLVREVWLLTPEEVALKRLRATPERNFLFSSEQQTSPHDDGKTAYDQLPRFPQ